MKRKVFLILVFLLVFSISNLKITESARYKNLAYQSAHESYESVTQEARVSTGEYVVDPSGGDILTQEYIYWILEEAGVVSYTDYDIDTILNSPELLELITSHLGYSPMLLGEAEALISYDQTIIKYGGKKYTEADILQIFEEKGIGIIDPDKGIINTLKNKKVIEIFKQEIEVDKLINILEEESNGKLGFTCKRNTLWEVILTGKKVIKFLNPLQECLHGCKEGVCIEKIIYKDTNPEEISPQEESKRSGVNIKEEEETKTAFIESPPLSIDSISIQLKELGLVSKKCKPYCLDFCGQQNGCGGICPTSDLNREFKCGNPSKRIEEPMDAVEAYQQTTSDIASGFQKVLKFILVD